MATLQTLFILQNMNGMVLNLLRQLPDVPIDEEIKKKKAGLVWFGLWWLTSLSTIFQLYCGRQFYWWRKPEYP